MVNISTFHYISCFIIPIILHNKCADISTLIANLLIFRHFLIMFIINKKSNNQQLLMIWGPSNNCYNLENGSDENQGITPLLVFPNRHPP